ncbi:MAG: T9SS type A sorting domain-containing protein [Brumimicrobium sp.]
MKRKVTLLSALTLSLGFAFGQSEYYNFGTPGPMGEYQGQLINVTKYKPSNANKALNVVWEEDFTGATNGTAPIAFSTTNGDYTLDGAEGDYWSQTNAANPPIGNPTGMNGRYMRWNSYDNVTNEAAGFATTDVNGAIRTPVIDLSGSPDNNLKLSFITASMFCCHPDEFPWAISVSTDGGTSFGAPILIDFGVSRNVNTSSLSSPLPWTVDLSGELDVDPTQNDEVVLEFRWVGDVQHDYPDGGFQFNTHYFWDLDDLKIYETPPYDLIVDKAWTGDIVTDFEVSEVPTSIGGDFVAQAKIINNGIQTPSNIELKVSIMDGATVLETATGGVLANNFSGSTDTITFDTGIDLSTIATGDYEVEYEILLAETDEDETNNIKTRSLSITDNTYATYNKDMTLAGESPGNSFSQTQGTSTEMKFGNVYMFDEDVTLHGVELAGHPGYQNSPTTEGEQLDIYIYEHDMSSWQFNFIEGPYEFEVTSDRLSSNGNRSIYNLHQPKEGSAASGPFTMQANTNYVIAFSHFGGEDTHFFYWGTPFDDDNSARMEGPFATGGNVGWFVYDEEANMALNLDESLNVSDEEFEKNSVKLYPNPTSESATVSYSLKSESPVSLEVRDLTGKVVYKSEETNQLAGSHKMKINTSNLSNGMYTYTLVSKDIKVTNKFVVGK